jgi:hypothetical protein
MNGNNLISLVRWPQRFLVTDRHWGDLWEGKRKATPLAPGAKQQRFKSRIKANTDPVDGRANVYGQGYFPVFIRTTLTLKLRKPGAFLAQCEG